MGKFATLGSRVPTTNLRVGSVAEKQVDPYYRTKEHQDWRAAVLRRARYQCEAIEDGRRCEASEQGGYALYADHIKEIKDGGAKTDLVNGQCLCARHHTLKTLSERERRFYESPATSAAS